MAYHGSLPDRWYWHQHPASGPVRHAITGSIETAVYGEETVVMLDSVAGANTYASCWVREFTRGIRCYRTPLRRDQKRYPHPFNIAVGHQRTRLAIRFQTVCTPLLVTKKVF